VEADLRLALGNVEFHYFAGYSGGAKAIMPGCASIQAIAHNHAMMVQSEASTGRLDGNPIREDLEEAAGLLPIDFLLNVVMDSDHRLIRAAAGDMHAAHRELCTTLEQHSCVSIPHKADIVLAGAGGFPKDINLYQAHKGLEIAAGFVREGGIVILAAACVEGFGHPTFETWFRETDSGAAIIQRLQREFILGGHKAAAIASILDSARVFLVSEIPEDDVRMTGMVPFASCQEALDHALDETGPDPSIIFLPTASSILPIDGS
jgi:nickel-dependent lactate racemase